MGVLEAPFSLLGLSLPEDQEKHVVLLKTDVYNEATYFAQLIGRAPAKSALIFMRGYNVMLSAVACVRPAHRGRHGPALRMPRCRTARAGIGRNAPPWHTT